MATELDSNPDFNAWLTNMGDNVFVAKSIINTELDKMNTNFIKECLNKGKKPERSLESYYLIKKKDRKKILEDFPTPLTNHDDIENIIKKLNQTTKKDYKLLIKT